VYRHVPLKGGHPAPRLSADGLDELSHCKFIETYKGEISHTYFKEEILMRKIQSFALLTLILIVFASMLPLLAWAKEESVNLMVVELWEKGRIVIDAISQTDDSMTNPDYKLLPFHWYPSTAKYWINPKNNYGFSASAVVTTITTSAETWDKQTAYAVFSYQGTISLSAGKRDNYNVVAWGGYQAGVIAVTYIWYSGSQILETDTRMNIVYKWSLSGEAGKMDVQNIMTHEFGHWAGLADLYGDVDYWLTMYGYANYGETYKRTLGLGDINGLEAWYGP